MAAERVQPVATVARELVQHHCGGVRATIWEQQVLKVFPVRGGSNEPPMVTLEIAGIPDDKFVSAVESLGLVWLGSDEIAHMHQLPHRMWHPFTYGRLAKYGFDAAADYWAQISTSLRLSGDTAGSELARKITFQARAASLRLRDISDEYGKQLKYALSSGVKVGLRFKNVELENLYLALHSFLYEMAAERDYIAAFISLYIIKTLKPVQYMTSLSKFLKGNAIDHELAKIILKETLEAPEAGWIARLSALRNRVAHSAPIHHAAECGWMKLRELANPMGHPIQFVHFELPDDKEDEASGLLPDGGDAQLTFFRLYLEMEEFSCLVARCSGIEPKIEHLTNKEIIGEIKEYKVFDPKQ